MIIKIPSNLVIGDQRDGYYLRPDIHDWLCHSIDKGKWRYVANLSTAPLNIEFDVDEDFVRFKLFWL